MMIDQTHPFVPLALMVICYLATLAATGQLRDALARRQMLDIPNGRSSHRTPVPRGGGLAVMAVVLPVAVLAALFTADALHYLPLIGGACILTGLSCLDDRRPLSPALRLGLHLAAASLGSLSLPLHALMLGGLLPFALDRALLILGWGWFMNLYNFMDGIDGITGVETTALATGICLVMSASGIEDPFLLLLCSALAASALGFLGHNWHPAKIFLGDCGSVPLGFLTGFGLLTLAAHHQFAPAVILPLYYLADSGITLARRARRGEKVWQAHREHFYQRALGVAGRHDRVVGRIAVVDIGLIVASVIAVTRPIAGLVLAAALVAVLLAKLHKKRV